MNLLDQCLPLFSCLPWLQTTKTIKINDRTVKVIRVLGEGGFSYVYLVADARSGQQYALKKIRCPDGKASVKAALKEVAASELFSHPTIIHIVDHAVVQESDGTTSVYLLLPYFDRGNLQEIIDSCVVNQTQLSRSQVLGYAKDVSIALTHVHASHAMENTVDDIDEDPFAEQETSKLISNAVGEQPGGNRVAHAHFDLKPANLMIGNEQRIVLMDFGSCKPARKKITSRLEALQIQDEAAEHSTMPYRAPELFDCPSNGSIDESVDIWSFGCVLYALLYGHSPFETAQTESGSIALAVLNCQYSFPSQQSSGLEHELQEIVRSCLQKSAASRPSAQSLKTTLTRLQNEHSHE